MQIKLAVDFICLKSITVTLPKTKHPLVHKRFSLPILFFNYLKDQIYLLHKCNSIILHQANEKYHTPNSKIFSDIFPSETSKLLLRMNLIITHCAEFFNCERVRHKLNLKIPEALCNIFILVTSSILKLDFSNMIIEIHGVCRRGVDKHPCVEFDQCTDQIYNVLLITLCDN